MQTQLENNEVGPEILLAERVRVLIPHNLEFAHYNAGVIGLNENRNILIFVREVRRANVTPGTPDKGNLLIYRSTPEKVEKIGQLDLSNDNVINWEDPRIFSSGEIFVDDKGVESLEVLMGLTAISHDNKAVAATVRGKVINGNFSIAQESLVVYLDDKGKNVTPISNDELLFRRQGDRHSLEVVKHSKDENGHDKLEVKKIIKFPQEKWCEWQIGTQAQMLPGGILPIHGVNKFSLGIDPQTGEEAFGYTYSIGLAQLDENLDVIKITDAPLFNRESFKNILPLGKELDTNKDVIYCCGYSVEGDIVKFIINIGDLMTVEVTKTMFELRRALDKSSPDGIDSRQIPEAAAA